MKSTPQQQRLIITGFMGAGKTTVAQALAQQLNSEMIDLDNLIVQQEQRAISEIINQDGEAVFREVETFALKSLLEISSARIIALGGGAWTLERNRQLLAAYNCITVWLDAPFELCWERIARAEELRPLALNYESAHQLYAARRAQYELAALHLQATAERSAGDLALEIINAAQQQRFWQA